MRDFINKFITDAVLISVVVAFTYSVLIAWQSNYYLSFGITEPTDLISLNFQSVIDILPFTAITVIALLFVMRRALFIEASKYNPQNKLRNMARNIISSSVASLVLILPVFLILVTALSNRTTIIAIGALVLFIILVIIFSRSPKEKIPNGTLRGDIHTFMNLFKETQRLPILFICLFLIMTTMYATALGYAQPRLSTNYQLTLIEDEPYVVINYTKERLVVAALDGTTVTPNYKYINLGNEATIEIQEKTGKLNFNEVGLLTKLN